MNALPVEHFDVLYRAGPDPWRMQGSWYEERKRALVLASLPARRYASAYEPGCGEGLLTQPLAARCDQLLATDVSPRALRTARTRLTGAPQVQWTCHTLPQDWPAGPFDLVVLSELLYYLTAAQLQALLARLAESLQPQATVLACHWRHPIEGCAFDGDAVHDQLHAGLGMKRVLQLRDADFCLDVWDQGSQGESLALREGRG